MCFPKQENTPFTNFTPPCHWSQITSHCLQLLLPQKPPHKPCQSTLVLHLTTCPLGLAQCPSHSHWNRTHEHEHSNMAQVTYLCPAHGEDLMKMVTVHKQLRSGPTYLHLNGPLAASLLSGEPGGLLEQVSGMPAPPTVLDAALGCVCQGPIWKAAAGPASYHPPGFTVWPPGTDIALTALTALTTYTTQNLV